jgi:hypothetical protein
MDTRSVAVGELLATVAEDGDLVGIPALCLLSAYRQAPPADRFRLGELVETEYGPAVVLPLLAPDVRQVAELSLGLRKHQAHAIAAARENDAILATYDRRSVAAELAEDDILDL